MGKKKKRRTLRDGDMVSSGSVTWRITGDYSTPPPRTEI